VEALIQELLNAVEKLTARVEELEIENQRLRDENARLKGEKERPRFKPSRSKNSSPSFQKKGSPTQEESEDERPRHKKIQIDRTEIISLERDQLPEDVKHRGYREVVIQNIRFETDTVLYRLERMSSESSGEFYEARLPEGLQGQSYGSELQAFVIMLYFELRVPQEKILNLLESQGIVISAGTISNILIKKHKDVFVEERQELLRAGLQTTSYHHIDDTGARENGDNCYFTTLCNPYYTSFFTHSRKDKDTIANLLSCLDGETSSCTARGDPLEEPTEADSSLRRYILILMADDASQFHNQTLYRALCWIHEERHYKKLHPFFEKHQKLVDDFREQLWAYYWKLKAYQQNPDDALKQVLSDQFDELFSQQTGYDELDHRIALTREKKSALLLVLKFPEVPLDNNEAERALREYVIKRKISNGTRTPEGSLAWEIFLSLVDTCRKNGVNFYKYLQDRISKSYQMPSLASLILAQGTSVTTPS